MYHGKKYGEEKERIFSESDIFVFPTYYGNQSFPLVLLEAMQHGLPCVNTDEGGIMDIVIDGGTGYICPKRDSFSNADALFILLENSALRLKMAKSGL